MNLLVDMNLSPRWVASLERHGFRAVHWSSIGDAKAPDDVVLSWARGHDHVLITNDLDFSAILAAGAGRAPSVVQIRAQDLLADATVIAVVEALERYRTQIEQGALLSIDESRTRARLLPLPN